MSSRRWLAAGVVGLTLWAAVPVLLAAQGPGGQGRGPLSPLVPPGIDLIVADPNDNTLIVRDPPVAGTGARPSLVLSAQWLEVSRNQDNTVRRFAALDAVPLTLTSGQASALRVRTPAGVASYPVQAGVGPDGLIHMTLWSAGPASRVVCRLTPADRVHLGESRVVSGMIAPQPDGSQRETYLQVCIERARKDGGEPKKD